MFEKGIYREGKMNTALRPAMLDFEERLIRKSLRQTKGNVAQAAKRLGVVERTLWAKIKRLSIDVSDYRL